MSTRHLPRPHTILSEDLDKHLTTAELSEIIAVSVRTIERWRISGDGPPFTKVGPRQVRYDLGLVREWLHKNTQPVTAQPVDSIVSGAA